ncbi:MAG TPA: glutamate--tRNA ligase [Candidatus Hydrogenedentes bacterium]|nr:glutamate--tRNA ligase [Candidatus Hydrogenedentota bacterium]
MSKIRVRFAPSPTGFFHIGNAKTALYNWLFARSCGGTFILRLEDTDVERSKEEYAEVLADCLQWLGLDWDEGPAFRNVPAKGAFGPYRQSERTELYRNEANRLLTEGKAYKCFCSKEELDAERERAAAEKRPPRYNQKCRNLTPEEIAAKGDAPYAVRFKVMEGVTEIDDIVQGIVRTDNKEVDDFIIVKPNGDPIFHLAVVVDDGLMKVTHVIRGDDHMTNAVRHVMLFKALGYELPIFCHHPLVHDEKGQKYSKRLPGANVLDWRRDGYLPEALINYLALLGWTPADGSEILTLHQLARQFTLERLSPSPSRFDLKKAQWLNGQHMRMLSVEALRDRVLPILNAAGFDTSSKSAEWLTRMTAICQEKIKVLNDIVPYTDFFFAEPAAYEEKAVRKLWQANGAADTMRTIRDTMAELDVLTADSLKQRYEALAESSGQGVGHYIHPTRLALTGKSVGPGLYELAELLGKETCLARIDRAIQYIEELNR